MTTQLIQQKEGQGSCAGCVAAMAAGTSFEDVVSFAGHDGSERAFSLLEVSSFLNAKGYWMGTAATFSYPVHTTTTPLDEIYLPPELHLSLDRLAKEYKQSVNELLRRAVLNLLESVGYKVSEPTEPSLAETGRPGHTVANIGHRLHGFNTYVSIKGQPAYVMVGGHKSMHAVYWDGFSLWDSARTIKENPVHWRDYTIYGFFPICRLGDK